MNVSTDNSACILLKFTYTNTETWSRLKVLTIVVMWWNIRMLEAETLQSDTPKLRRTKCCLSSSAQIQVCTPCAV